MFPPPRTRWHPLPTRAISKRTPPRAWAAVFLRVVFLSMPTSLSLSNLSRIPPSVHERMYSMSTPQSAQPTRGLSKRAQELLKPKSFAQQPPTLTPRFAGVIPNAIKSKAR